MGVAVEKQQSVSRGLTYQDLKRLQASGKLLHDYYNWNWTDFAILVQRSRGALL